MTGTACSPRNGQLVVYDVAYGTDSLQRMDLHFVEGRDAATPLVMLIHGGGWMAGDKHDADFMREALFARGINVVNVNYRLGGETVHYPEMMADIDAAIGYLLSHAREWGVRSSGIVLWGGSAGAHLALLLSLIHIYYRFRIWVSCADYMNDPLEGVFFRKCLHEAFLRYQSAHDLPDKSGYMPFAFTALNLNRQTFYAFSLSEHADSLPMWVAYGNNGQGVAIGFDTEEFARAAAEYPYCHFLKMAYRTGGEFAEMFSDEDMARAYEAIRPREDGGCSVSVSYTHLDVYKRQVSARGAASSASGSRGSRHGSSPPLRRFATCPSPSKAKGRS